jgi:hypothetical protein
MDNMLGGFLKIVTNSLSSFCTPDKSARSAALNR